MDGVVSVNFLLFLSSVGIMEETLHSSNSNVLVRGKYISTKANTNRELKRSLNVSKITPPVLSHKFYENIFHSPPHKMKTTLFPLRSSNKPATAAANPVAPAPSTTHFSSSTSLSTESAILASSTWTNRSIKCRALLNALKPT